MGLLALCLLATLPASSGILFDNPETFGLFPMKQSQARAFYPLLFSTHVFYTENEEGFYDEKGEYVPPQLDDTIRRVDYKDHDLIAEWRAYTRGQVPVIEIYGFLYEKAPDCPYWQDCFRGNGPGQSMMLEHPPQNQLITYAARQKDPSLLHYLQFCKTVEKAFDVIAEPWGFEEPVYQYANSYSIYSDSINAEWQQAIGPLQQQALHQSIHCKDAWLRRRYAFQALLLARYRGDYAACQQIFAQHFDQPYDTPGLYRWAQLHMGKGLMEMGRKAEGNLLLAQALAYSTTKQQAAHQLFDKEALAPALALAKTNEEKAALWFAYALQNPAFERPALKQVQALSGHSELLRVLVLREIGKIDDFVPATFGNYIDNYVYAIEEPLLSPSFHFYHESKQAKIKQLGPWQISWPPPVRKHIQELLPICQAAVADAAAARPLQWRLMKAHLHFYLNQLDSASAIIDDLVQQRVSPNLRYTLVGYQAMIKTFDQSLDQQQRRAALVPFLEKLVALQSRAVPKTEVAYMLIKRFEQLDDQLGADMLELIIGAGVANREPLQLLAGLEKNSLGPMGALARRADKKQWQRLYRIAAINALVEENPAQAAVYYDKAGETEPYLYLDEDPTRVNYYRNHGTNKWPDSSHMSRVQWCRHVAHLQAGAAGNFEKTLALANCYYNMTHEGNSWAVMMEELSTSLWEYGPWKNRNKLPPRYRHGYSMFNHPDPINGYTPFLPPVQQRKFYLVYLGGLHALKYFQRAQQLAPTPEAAAACGLMVARCRYMLQHFHLPQEDKAISRHPAYADLYRQFPQLAPQLVGSCQGFERFIKMR